MHSIWCCIFLAGPPAANRWSLYGRTFSATGGKPTMAGDTSCSRAANATARRGSSMLGITMTASGFSGAANVLASPINRQWATVGTARRVASKGYALGSNGARTVPCRSNRAACMNGRINVSWGFLPTTRPCENRGRAMLENPGQISTMPIYGGNAETDLRALADGRVAELHSRQRGCWDPETRVLDGASPSKSS